MVSGRHATGNSRRDTVQDGGSGWSSGGRKRAEDIPLAVELLFTEPGRIRSHVEFVAKVFRLIPLMLFLLPFTLLVLAAEFLPSPWILRHGRDHPCHTQEAIAEQLGVERSTISGWMSDFATCPNFTLPPDSRQHFDIWQFQHVKKNAGQQSYFGALIPQIVQNLLCSRWREQRDERRTEARRGYSTEFKK
jgi:hypothetical protein